MFLPYNPPSQEQVDQWQLSGESFTRGLMSFLKEELSKDQMFTLLSVLSIVNKDERMNGYFAGVVGTSMGFRFGLCSCRGITSEEEHTVDSHFEMGEDTESEQAKTQPSDGLPSHQFPDDVTAEEVTDDATDELSLLSQEKLNELLETYKLDTSDQPGDPRVQCRRCGVTYPNLADRMLRGPGECSGCEQAEKNGNWLNRWA